MHAASFNGAATWIAANVALTRKLSTFANDLINIADMKHPTYLFMI